MGVREKPDVLHLPVLPVRDMSPVAEGTIKIKTGEIIPMKCLQCEREGINRISMSTYNSNGFFCECGYEIEY